MNPAERLKLQDMVKDNNTVETTDLIRSVKHSKQIRDNVNTLLNLRIKNEEIAKNKPDEFDDLCIYNCGFLFNHYTDIYNKVKKDEVDMNILDKFLDVLEKIENELIDQHEGSFEIGKLLKELYIDSALRKADKLDKQNEDEPDKRESKVISWSEWKRQQ
jgi:hypothetical protein